MTESVLLADIDFQVVLFAVMAVIYAIGWVAKKAKEASQSKGTSDRIGNRSAEFQPDSKPKWDVQVNRRQPAGAGEGVQQEIDRFLREVTGQQQAQPAAPEARPTQIVDIMESPVAGEPASSTEVRSRPKPGQRLHDRHMVEDRELGHGVNEHVTAHLGADHSKRWIDEDWRPAVTTEAAESVRSGQVAADALVRLLRRPEGIRQAMLVHEILSPPKGRRGRQGA